MCESVDRITKFLSPEQLLEYSKSKKGITNVDDTFNYKGTLKEESNISVKLELKNNKYIEFQKKYGNTFETPSIPISWKVKHEGCSEDGNSFKYSINFSGPINDLTYTLSEINKFYEGFNVTVRML